MDGLADGSAPRCPRKDPEWAQLVAAALEIMPEGVVGFDADLRVCLLSGRARSLLGLPRGLATPATLSDLLEASPRLERGAVMALTEACLRATTPGMPPEARLRIPGAPGLLFGICAATTANWILRIAPDTGPALGGTDPLTGLASRAMFEARLAAALDRPARRRFGCAILVCELEGIRAVNQMLGHAIGEDLLRAAARRLQAAVRESDLVARMAGEEFAILQGEVTDPAQAAALAQRLVDLLGRPYLVSGETIVVVPRIGFAIAPADGREPALLLRRAAMARNETPIEGRGAWCRFQPEMEQRWQEARSLEAALRTALAENQFELHFQPQVSLRDGGRLTGFEALIRWRHPERGVIPPSAFLPMAERLGLMRRIGNWVIRSACRTAATWPEGLTVAVNIAPAQFERGSLPKVVAEALAAARLVPERLEVEVTESVLLASGDAALGQLRALRDMGVRIAMDDFGTGYSSLTQLRIFPFDRLKIDRSFVKDLPAGGGAAAIVRAVIGLGHSLGIPVTAEGVETREQLAELMREGCDAAQGYYFGRPSAEGELPAILERLACPVLA